MRIKLLLSIFSILILTSCIGDARIKVSYKIKNETNKSLIVKSKSFVDVFSMNDTTLFILPNKEKIVFSNIFICAFSDCKEHIKYDAILDSLKYCFEGNMNQQFIIKKSDWKIKKHSVSIFIKQ